MVRVPSACVLLLLPCGLSPTDGRVSDVAEAVDAIANSLACGDISMSEGVVEYYYIIADSLNIRVL